LILISRDFVTALSVSYAVYRPLLSLAAGHAGLARRASLWSSGILAASFS
jgi:hypothetical protein